MKKTLLATIALLTSVSVNAATVNDYMRDHPSLQRNPIVLSMILDWINDPVNKDTTETGYEMAQAIVSESAQACLAGYSKFDNDDCQAVIYTASDR